MIKVSPHKLATQLWPSLPHSAMVHEAAPDCAGYPEASEAADILNDPVKALIFHRLNVRYGCPRWTECPACWPPQESAPCP